MLDSRRENFRLSRPYCDEVDVINVITAPEIGMLIILNEGKYDQFKNPERNPANIVNRFLRMRI